MAQYETPRNYEAKTLIVLVLDTSGSMDTVVDNTGVVSTGRTETIDGKVYNIVNGGISRIMRLQDALRDGFYRTLSDDVTTASSVEVAVITFDDSVKVVQPATLAEECVMPVLETGDKTALCQAVREAIALVDGRKQYYKNTSQPYYRPIIMLITDGTPEPYNEQEIVDLAKQIDEDTQKKKYILYPIGVDGADMTVLRRLEGWGNFSKGEKIEAKKLDSSKFNDLLVKLSASVSTSDGSDPGDTEWWKKMSL